MVTNNVAIDLNIRSSLTLTLIQNYVSLREMSAGGGCVWRNCIFNGLLTKIVQLL